MKHDVTSLLQAHSTSRRQFLKASAIASGLMAAGQMAPAAVAGFSLGRAAAQDGDVGILNFALSLEYFERDLYSVLVESGLATTPQVQSYLEFYGAQEGLHVDFLTAALGDAAAADPGVDSYKLPELSSEEEVLDTLMTVEDLGASAYLGAAPAIENGDYLEAAVRIHSTEAYHATGIRLLRAQYYNAGFETTFPDFGEEGPEGDSVAEGTPPEKVADTVAAFGVMPLMPAAGGGALNRGGTDSGRLFGLAGASAAALAGVKLLRDRRVAENS